MDDHQLLTYLRPEVKELKRKIDDFVENECVPAEIEFDKHLENLHGIDRWTSDAIPPCIHTLKEKAKSLGLWNLFIPKHLIHKVPDPALLAPQISLSYREYGILCESIGRSPYIAPEVLNTNAPDTGNMEVLLEFGNDYQRNKYLIPLLRGDIRSTFLMTEPNVASSDPTNLQTKLIKTINPKTHRIEYILSGHKWWSTGAMHPHCKLALVVAKMDYSHPSLKQNDNNNEQKQSLSKHGVHTIVAVPMPHPGVRVVRALTAFGYDDAPTGHAEVILDNIILSEQDLILGEGSGFQVSQARLGPGRIHHCMRSIGMASRAYELMLQRSLDRQTFGKTLAEHGGVQEMIADAVIDLDAARLLTLSCAATMDSVGVKGARDKIAAIKVAVPSLTYAVIDRAVQLHGGAGVSGDGILARFLVGIRTLRIADGPDAVHKRTVARIELKKALSKTKTKRTISRL